MELKQLFQKQTSVNLFEIARYFGISQEVAKELVAVWQMKGRVIEMTSFSSCSQPCGGCADTSVKRYRWV